MNMFSTKKLFLSLFVGFFFYPYLASAATIYFDTNEKDFFVGDNIVVNVMLDSEGKEINAAEGKVFLDYQSQSVSIGDLSVAGSDFSLWAQKPYFSINEREVYFVGGLPKGINSKNILVFKIVLNLEKPGKLSLGVPEHSVYLNDGKGTRENVNVIDFNMDILPKPQGFESRQEWTSVLESDNNPPKDFEINLGQEGSIFDGKKFISFNSTDDESGLSYYEVLENDLSPVRSDGTYVLEEQNKESKITVIAYDAAGNSRRVVYVVTVEDKSASNKYLPLYVLITLLLASLYWYRRNGKLKNEITNQ